MPVDMSAEARIEALMARVWEGLNDPDILREYIPGCEKLEMTSPTGMVARVSLRIGPIKATFDGEVTLKNLDPPRAYTIEGEGKGGVAGFAKGGADVTLSETEDGATLLRYTARADVGGKIAQLGSRLIQSTSKKLAAQFFSNFSQRVAGAPAGEA